MPKRIKIGMMNVTTTPTTLYNGFAGFGTIVDHSIDCDDTGLSLGVGHIEYTTAQAGIDAIDTMHNVSFDGSVITVTEDVIA